MKGQPAGSARGHSQNITVDPAHIEAIALWLSKALKKQFFLVLAATGTGCPFGELLQAGFPWSKFRFIGVYLPASLCDYARESVAAGNLFEAQWL